MDLYSRFSNANLDGRSNATSPTTSTTNSSSTKSADFACAKVLNTTGHPNCNQTNIISSPKNTLEKNLSDSSSAKSDDFQVQACEDSLALGKSVGDCKTELAVPSQGSLEEIHVEDATILDQKTEDETQNLNLIVPNNNMESSCKIVDINNTSSDNIGSSKKDSEKLSCLLNCDEISLRVDKQFCKRATRFGKSLVEN